MVAMFCVGVIIENTNNYYKPTITVMHIFIFDAIKNKKSNRN